MGFELSIVTFIQYIAHYVADIIHNFPNFMSFLNWAGGNFNYMLSVLPSQFAHIIFFCFSSAFLVRLVKF